MSNYTVKSGDNLWNVIKRELKLTNNTEIANKVNEISQNNKISNPNLIFAGQKIELGDAMDTLEKTNPKETEKPATTGSTNPITNPAVAKKEYSPEITKAVQDKEKSRDIKTYDDVKNSFSTKVSIFSPNTQTAEQKERAYEDYSESLLTSHYDKNGDGTVSVEEFAQTEESGSLKTNEISRKYDETKGITSSESDVENDNRIANRSANLFAKNIDMDGDGIISKKEFAFFNKTADSLDGKEDGIIQAENEGDMFQSVTGMNAHNKEINAVVNKYLLGQTLTPEEQRILDDSSVKIRAALLKVSGAQKAD